MGAACTLACTLGLHLRLIEGRRSGSMSNGEAGAHGSSHFARQPRMTCPV